MYKIIYRPYRLFKTTQKVDALLVPVTGKFFQPQCNNNNLTTTVIHKKFDNCYLLERYLGTMATGESTTTTATKKPKHTNRLIEEKSPYLLQHAHNPVDWYPWGEEAIERARRENKLIFLSVGYSTCHWCHVMEHESFENETVANLMNDNFINIKVDREERPDIDKIYMQFVLMTNSSGGWPMSVWLTPDLAPISAGTYFPPQDRYGMPSFSTVLRALASKWSTNQEGLQSTGLQVITALRKTLSEQTSSEMMSDAGNAEIKLLAALNIFERRFDKIYGGFGSHPKFPEVSRLNFLFHAFVSTKNNAVLEMVVNTLEHIATGGIHDQIFGGFSRYSVDRYWHVPHFEKMLYDQAQLMSAYATAYKLTNNANFLIYADGIFRYITRDLQHAAGGFFAGEDADSLPTANDEKKIEGAFYAWEAKEIYDIISSHTDQYAKELTAKRIYDIYAAYYDVRENGNVEHASDPHGHIEGKNILIIRNSVEEIKDKFKLTQPVLDEILHTTNKLLDNVRNQRPRPHLDTKIICAWNGLILSGLSKLADCGGDKRNSYMAAAEKLINFIRTHLYDAEKQVLLRTCYGKDGIEIENLSGKNIDGFLDDYAFLIRGLLDFYKTSLNEEVLRWAKELQDLQDKLFWDAKNGAYFYSKADATNIIVRLKDDHDGAEPCGNSVSATNLILLSNYFNDENYSQRAQKLLDFFADTNAFGYTLPEMMSALLLLENGIDLVAIVGPNTDQNTNQFIEIIQKFYIPGIIVIRVDPQHPITDESIYNQRMQEKFKMINNKPTVYICHDKICRMPVTEPIVLEQNLREFFFKN